MRCAWLLLLSTACAQADRGILSLDNTTFDRIVGSFAALVRIDKEYSYGDADDAFKEVAKTIGESSAKVLVCEVGVAEPPSPYQGEDSYGEGAMEQPPEDPDAWRENQDLADRFGVSEDEYPKFIFFAAGYQRDSSPLVFEGPHEKDALLRFVQEKAAIWIGLPGQDEQLHLLAKEYAAATADARKAVAEKARALGSSGSTASYYLKVMDKAISDEAFLGKETARLRKIVDDGSLSQNKREQFSRRLNALSSFTA